VKTVTPEVQKYFLPLFRRREDADPENDFEDDHIPSPNDYLPKLKNLQDLNHFLGKSPFNLIEFQKKLQKTLIQWYAALNVPVVQSEPARENRGSGPAEADATGRDGLKRTLEQSPGHKRPKMEDEERGDAGPSSDVD